MLSRLLARPWGSQPTTTFAGLPGSAAPGTTVFISNAGTKGSHWFYDGTRWKPMNGMALLTTMDTASAANTNVEAIQFQYLLPAGLLQVGDRLRLYAGSTKNGAVDTASATVRLGTAGTTSDTAILNAVFAMNTTTLQHGMIMDFRLESATSLQALHSNRGAAASPPGYSFNSATASQAATTISSAASNALYFSVAMTSVGTTNTVTMTDAQLQIIAKGG